MKTVTVQYLGELRVEATHEQSGSSLITDGPLDNEGQGESFSPTDLLATASLDQLGRHADAGQRRGGAFQARAGRRATPLKPRGPSFPPSPVLDDILWCKLLLDNFVNLKTLELSTPIIHSHTHIQHVPT